jgi:hypothetical protein
MIPYNNISAICTLDSYVNYLSISNFALPLDAGRKNGVILNPETLKTKEEASKSFNEKLLHSKIKRLASHSWNEMNNGDFDLSKNLEEDKSMIIRKLAKKNIYSRESPFLYFFIQGQLASEKMVSDAEYFLKRAQEENKSFFALTTSEQNFIEDVLNDSLIKMNWQHKDLILLAIDRTLCDTSPLTKSTLSFVLKIWLKCAYNDCSDEELYEIFDKLLEKDGSLALELATAYIKKKDYEKHFQYFRITHLFDMFLDKDRHLALEFAKAFIEERPYCDDSTSNDMDKLQLETFFDIFLNKDKKLAYRFAQICMSHENGINQNDFQEFFYKYFLSEYSKSNWVDNPNDRNIIQQAFQKMIDQIFEQKKMNAKMPTKILASKVSSIFFSCCAGASIRRFLDYAGVERRLVRWAGYSFGLFAVHHFIQNFYETPLGVVVCTVAGLGLRYLSNRAQRPQPPLFPPLPLPLLLPPPLFPPQQQAAPAA